MKKIKYQQYQFGGALMKKLAVYLLAVVVLGGLALGVCQASESSPAPSKQSKYGGTFTFIRGKMPPQFGWTPTFAAGEAGPAYPCVECLVREDKKGQPQPHLATDWQIAPDSSSITLNLRKGIKFHDGTDFNAEAVKYNLDLVMTQRPGELIGVKSVDVVDKYTVRLNLDFFSNNIWNRLASRIQISSPAHLAKGKDHCLFHPLGTGPFIFKDFERDVFVSYTRNDNYWQEGKPYLDSMKLVWIADPVTASASLRAGEADAFYPPYGRYKEPADLAKKGFDVNSTAGLIMGLAPDTRDPKSIYNNPKVRKALGYTIDREALTEAMGYGFLETRTQFAPPGYLGYIEGLEREYNPEKARQLLSEAGHPDGFKATVIADAAFVSRDIMAGIQAYLAAVGIDAKIDFADPGRYANWRRKTGWHGLMFMRNGGFPWIPNLMSFILDLDRNDYASMERPEGFQKVLDELLGARDSERQSELAQQATQMLFDHATFVPLYTSPQLCLTAPYVHDHGICEATIVQWTPENLWIEK